MNKHLIYLGPAAWQNKRKTIAMEIARQHGRKAELWEFYTPEAELLMSRTWYSSHHQYPKPANPSVMSNRRAAGISIPVERTGP